MADKHPDLTRVDAVLDEAYAAGAVEGDDGTKHPVYPVATDQRQGRGVRELVAAEQASKTFEVGFALGLSTLNIAAGLLEGGQPDVHHTAIDPTEGWLWGNAGTRLVERAGLAGIVSVVEESSHVELPRWLEERRAFDIAFIDGDHRFDPCFLDIYYALRMVKGDGLVIVDDMWMPAVRMAVAFFETNVGLEMLPDAVPDGFRWSRRRRRGGVRSGTGNTAVLRKPTEHVERPGEHFVPFW